MFKPKIWLRLGALAVASSATALPKPILATETQEYSKEAPSQPGTAGPVLAQSGRRGAGGEGGERGSGRRSDRAPARAQQSGDGGEAGERGVNTRYIFGFTEGADTERAREKEFENDTV